MKLYTLGYLPRRALLALVATTLVSPPTQGGIIASSTFKDSTPANSTPAVQWTPVPKVDGDPDWTAEARVSVSLSAAGTVDESTSGANLGIRVDTSEMDPTQVSDYRWVHVNGRKYPSFAAGIPVVGNPTDYTLFIAYAKDSTGTDLVLGGRALRNGRRDGAILPNWSSKAVADQYTWIGTAYRVGSGAAVQAPTNASDYTWTSWSTLSSGYGDIFNALAAYSPAKNAWDFDINGKYNDWDTPTKNLGALTASLARVPGKYLHVAFATGPNGEGISLRPDSSGGFTSYTHIGTYVSSSAYSSQLAAAYTWVTLSSVEANPTKGIAAVDPESPNTTYYLHLKYSQTNGQTFTASNGETPSIFPPPPGVPTACLRMTADFRDVPQERQTWKATLKTPILDIGNVMAGTELGFLNLAFDLAANRTAKIKVRVSSFPAAGNTPNGFAEGTVRPIASETFYRYSLDLDRLTNGSKLGGSDFQTNATRVQFSFILEGNQSDALNTWPREQYNIVRVDNISFTKPTFFVAPNFLENGTTPRENGSGLTVTDPKPLDLAMALVEPGDVICLNPGTYINGTDNYTLPLGGVTGSPAKWVRIRSTDYNNRAVLRGRNWTVMEFWGDTAYIDITGLTIKGYWDSVVTFNQETKTPVEVQGPDAAVAGLTLAGATAEFKKLNTVPTREEDPAYSIWSDHNLSDTQRYIPAIRDAFGNLFTPEIFAGLAENRVAPSPVFNTDASTAQPTRVSTGATRTARLRSYTTLSNRPDLTSHHLRFADNIVINNSGGGLGAGSRDYVYIENNVVMRNNKINRYGASGIPSTANRNFDGTKGYRIFILGNIVADNGSDVPWGPRSTHTRGTTSYATNWSDGNGIIVDSPDNSYFTGDHLIANNIVYDNGGGGIHVLKAGRNYPGFTKTDVINNTVFRNQKPNNGFNDVTSSIKTSTTQHQGFPGTTDNDAFATYRTTGPTDQRGGEYAINYGEMDAQLSDQVSFRNNLVWAREGAKIIGDLWGKSVSLEYNVFGRDGGFNNSNIRTSSTIPSGWALTKYVNDGGTALPDSKYVYNIEYKSAATQTPYTIDEVFENSTNPQASGTFLHPKYSSTPLSPAINRGNIYYSNAPRDDFLGRQRPQGSVIDVGAIESLPFAELLSNPGFEGVPPEGGWTLTSGAGQVDGTWKRSGAYAAQLRSGTTGGGVYRSISGLTPNTTYLLRGWARLEEYGSGGFNLFVSTYGGPQINQPLSTETKTWKEYTIVFTTGPSNTSATIGFWRNYSGYGSFDDMSVSRY